MPILPQAAAAPSQRRTRRRGRRFRRAAARRGSAARTGAPSRTLPVAGWLDRPQTKRLDGWTDLRGSGGGRSEGRRQWRCCCWPALGRTGDLERTHTCRAAFSRGGAACRNVWRRAAGRKGRGGQPRAGAGQLDARGTAGASRWQQKGAASRNLRAERAAGDAGGGGRARDASAKALRHSQRLHTRQALFPQHSSGTPSRSLLHWSALS